MEKIVSNDRTGILNIDSNPVENSIRPIAVGRKNYLFAGSHSLPPKAGKQPSKVPLLYSLLGTSKMNGIEPYQKALAASIAADAA
jgi:hypothetical protein